jgi:two-component system, LytTR family, response regulator
MTHPAAPDAGGAAGRIRVLIVDDEPLARQRLEDLLAAEQGVDIVAQAGDGQAAVEAIRTLRPDVVFLDIQMPGMTGLDVVREIGPAAMPATIFVTAYDRYALKAFDVAALDYLVKPFDDERFEQAFARARQLISLQQLGRLRGQMLQVLQSDVPTAAPIRTPSPSPYLERIAVEMRGRVQVVPVDAITHITASGPYAELHTQERRYVIREPMQGLEDRLDPKHFVRIHRSTIVRLALIDTLVRGGGGEYEVRLKTGQRLKVSRSRREELEARLGVL